MFLEYLEYANLFFKLYILWNLNTEIRIKDFQWKFSSCIRYAVSSSHQILKPLSTKGMKQYFNNFVYWYAEMIILQIYWFEYNKNVKINSTDSY